jgi:coenzyme F420-dependent oxidoreductase
MPSIRVIGAMLATGVTFGSSSKEELLEYAQLAEESGLESVWLGESWGRSSVPVLTQILERTDSIDAGAGIFNIYTRTPSLVAMTANTLADLSDGRFRVGLGASGPAVVENFHGVEFEAPLRRTREYIEIVRAYLRGDRVDYEGEIFDLSGFSLDMETHYESPIYVASMGETNRQLTGEFADGWMPLLIPSSGLEDALEAVERGTDRGDRSMDDCDVMPWIPTCVSETDPEAARDVVRAKIAFYVGAMGDYYANVVSEFGFETEAEAIQQGWEENTQAGAESAVTDEMVEMIGAGGTPDEAAESFERFVDSGADSPVASIPTRWASDELTRETIRHL